MEIILQLDTEAATALQRHSLPQSHLDKLNDLLSIKNATLRPQHPGIDDHELSRFFVVSSSDDEDGTFLNELRSIEYVTSVYQKQASELP